MTEIAMRDQQTAVDGYHHNAMDHIDRWLQQADAVFSIAERICRTAIVPVAYRNKPDEAGAAMLAGIELGIGPIASLSAFDSIQGTPALNARTMRGIVQRAGHDLDIVESDENHAVAVGRRKGSENWQRVEWDLARAIRAGYVAKNKKYETSPEEMFVARATAELARRIASDALMGMPYAAEEIADERIIDAAPVVRRLTAAELDEPVELVDDGVATTEQHQHIHELWREIGYGGEENRGWRLDRTAKILGLERLGTSADLTREQADQVIAALVERKNAAPPDAEQ